MIEDKKAALRREIERRERELERLENIPEFESLADGMVLALVVTLGRSHPYNFIAYKVRGLWYLTGERSPNGVSGDALAEWLTTGGRRLEAAVALAEFVASQVKDTVAVDLAAMLDSLRDDADPARRLSRVCMDDSCGCSGQAHP